ncbi:Uncharacterized integral membrane protein [Marinobacter daqiaonensis]|uniref:Uncharacterized integral membrane protein n=1 Tax=Marinobacter daqiaonensis TaxID=650891 RepID=A0A1I6HEQ5_9GAMM|nr:hypothetical protein [Marinobacter daqiaonensis]SFR52854.1 Uncharacterized integral membrane protein [Marinobacter daqiaonensis]
MNSSVPFSGERHDHKLAAKCDSEKQAKELAEALCENTTLSSGQVHVVTPDQSNPGASLEPENRGIRRTLVRSLVWMTVIGAVVGFVLYLILAAVGVNTVSDNPFFSGAAMPAYGAMIGLIVGGILALRPDHTAYAASAETSLRKGDYVVAIHAADSEQLDAAKQFLEARDVETTVRSL